MPYDVCCRLSALLPQDACLVNLWLAVKEHRPQDTRGCSSAEVIVMKISFSLHSSQQRDQMQCHRGERFEGLKRRCWGFYETQDWACSRLLSCDYSVRYRRSCYESTRPHVMA